MFLPTNQEKSARQAVPQGGRLPYEPSLDGLRGIAVLLVVAGHVMAGAFPAYRGLDMASLGGLIGVQLFFVLSGYLITRLLLNERARTGGISLRRFYVRRFRRLFPSLAIVVAAFVVLSGDLVEGARGITYTMNIQAGPHGNGWLSHTWTLAVEEQFYLVWPALMVIFRRWAVVVAVVGIAATLIAQNTIGWSEGAISTGMRWDALLAGCLLAMVGDVRVGRVGFWIGFVTALAYTAGLLGGSIGTIDYPIATCAGVLMIAGAREVKFLEAGWLVHVGLISYALYLWHVLMLRLDAPWPLTLAASFLLAELTWQTVDRWAQGRDRLPRGPEYRPTAGAEAEDGAAASGVPARRIGLPPPLRGLSARRREST